ncbi:hypothetical protein [Kutzneria buriramensis]|uniref:Uncharacterized protein n=1 Tax=Kutzneria buriramensis TaxID=1045776 RepID=A0A3E0HTX4_9PSEU|nr:hypothetical protein [Kutzneria buriramensis]REH49868.1 hypothetical protein BCF44_104131 [Kutzneria buriramensis]
MNGDSPHGGQPWSVDLLADLHADGGDRTALDADAHAVLSALDTTQAELAALPPMRMPDDVAARIDAALAVEAAARAGAVSPVTPFQAAAAPVPPQATGAAAMPSAPVPLRPAAAPPAYAQHPAPVVDLAEARRRRNRRLGIAGGLITAAAAVAGVVFVVLPGNNTAGIPQAVPLPTTSSSVQTDPQNNGPLTLRDGDLPAAGIKAVGFHDYGPFADAGKLDACLTANGQPAGTKPIFGRPATLEGRPVEMFLLSTGKPVRYQLLVVGAECAAGNPATVANSTIGH